MNTLLNTTKSVSLIVNSFTKNNSFITRGLRDNFKIKWVKPAKIPSTHPSKSGDSPFDFKTSSHEVALEYQESKELKDAPDIVKKLFTLEYMPTGETKRINAEKARNLVKRHDLDYMSMESTVAILTSRIRHLQKEQEKHPRNKACKHFLKELIDKRKKFLSHLRRWDYKRFEWILEKLNITYHPHPELPVTPTRSGSIRQLTTIHCDKIRQAKLDAYRYELESQQKDFFNEKLEKLKFIRAEEIACGVKPTISEEEIAAAEEKAAQFQ